MDANARIDPNEAHQVQPDVRSSRIRSLRILGGLQIGLGVVCGILGIVGAILTVVFSSTVFGLAVVGAIALDINNRSVAVSGLLAVFSFIEFIISIVAASHCCCCSQLNTGNQQTVIFMSTAQSGMMYSIPNTQIATGNQQGYHQMWIPQMQGYYVQQPANMSNNQQQVSHLQGNQMPIQGYYSQQPANMPSNQQQADPLQGNQMPIQESYSQQPANLSINQQQASHLQGNQMPIQGYFVQQPANLPNNQEQADPLQENQMSIQEYYGQQPANMPNNQQQAEPLQGNQMPKQGYYGQQPANMPNNQQQADPLQGK
ncbi:Hypothetical predicted protein [Mytilus galloprovincialis]|uniref:Uncharacterized protein n=1 Tax=Mytilus galloprovincialis TaxID=29158 RepID=A0A8B6DVQ7_MYTGA|nr:Hypothetical predicted protein [Mytilus galloprovincialis]